jgi:hypothetical protein
MSEAMDPDQHWRKVTDSNSEWFTHADIRRATDGGDTIVVRISGARAGSGKFQGGSKKGVVLRFVGFDRPLMVNPTNGTMLERLLGGIYNRWVGRDITVYIGRATRGRKRDDPPAGPGESDKTIEVDAVRIRPMLPAKGAVPYGVANGNAPASPSPDFDLDGWLAAIADCPTREEFEQLRADLNGTKRPASAREPLAKAIEAARVRLFEGAQ